MVWLIIAGGEDEEQPTEWWFLAFSVGKRAVLDSQKTQIVGR